MLQRLDVKLVLAAISGALVSFVVTTPDLGIEEAFDWEVVRYLYDYGLSGALFAVSILWPYLRRDDHFLSRGVALVAASAVSFWSAVNVCDSAEGVVSFPAWMPEEYLASSIVGAGIVFLAAKYIVPFNWARRYLFIGLLAAIAGGWVFGLLVDGPGPEFLFSFIAWHCIVCAALHFGTRRVGEPGHA